MPLAALVLMVTLPACGDSSSGPRDSALPQDTARDQAKEGSAQDQAAMVLDTPAPADLPAAVDVLPISSHDAVASPAMDGFAAEAPPSGQGTVDSGVADIPALGANDAADALDGGAALEAGIDLSVDPRCSGADSTGFFASCSSCLKPGDCDSISVGGLIRRACACSTRSDCPCGFDCGCHEVAPRVRMCGICVRP